jgi:hypothetical protein
MIESRAVVHSGGCQCGAVRYALFAHPERTHICHCRMCQKAVGGPFAAFAPVRLADFAWTRGTPAAFLSSSMAARDYCKDCGTPLTFRYLYYPDSDSLYIELRSSASAETRHRRRHPGRSRCGGCGGRFRHRPRFEALEPLSTLESVALPLR